MATSVWHYPRTALTEAVITAFERNDGHAFLVNARRRMGKTSFLIDDLKPKIDDRRAWRAVYVDFWEGQSAPHIRLAHEIQKHLNLTASDFIPDRLKRLRITSAIEAEMYETKSAIGPDGDPLLALDDMIGKLASQNDRVVFLFDEFQEVVKHKGGRSFLEQVRGSLNKRTHQIKTVFTGSSTDGLRDIFEDRKGPFYNFATPLPFPPFGEDFVDHCIHAFERSTGRKLDRPGSLRAFDELDRVTQNFREFLKSMMLDPGLTPGAALDVARQRFSDDYRFNDLWAAIQPRDRALLAIMAGGEKSLYGRYAASRIAELAQLSKTPSRSAIQTALNRLSTRRVVDRSETDGWTFMDPEFRRWIAVNIPDG